MIFYYFFMPNYFNMVTFLYSLGIIFLGIGAAFVGKNYRVKNKRNWYLLFQNYILEKQRKYGLIVAFLMIFLLDLIGVVGGASFYYDKFIRYIFPHARIDKVFPSFNREPYDRKLLLVSNLSRTIDDSIAIEALDGDLIELSIFYHNTSFAKIEKTRAHLIFSAPKVNTIICKLYLNSPSLPKSIIDSVTIYSLDFQTDVQNPLYLFGFKKLVAPLGLAWWKNKNSQIEIPVNREELTIDKKSGFLLGDIAPGESGYMYYGFILGRKNIYKKGYLLVLGNDGHTVLTSQK